MFRYFCYICFQATLQPPLSLPSVCCSSKRDENNSNKVFHFLIFVTTYSIHPLKKFSTDFAMVSLSNFHEHKRFPQSLQWLAVHAFHVVLYVLKYSHTFSQAWSKRGGCRWAKKKGEDGKQKPEDSDKWEVSLERLMGRQNRVKYPIATVPEHATVTETTMPCNNIFLTTWDNICKQIYQTINFNLCIFLPVHLWL